MKEKFSKCCYQVNLPSWILGEEIMDQEMGGDDAQLHWGVNCNILVVF
jgi:hypothetical protein